MRSVAKEAGTEVVHQPAEEDCIGVAETKRNLLAEQNPVLQSRTEGSVGGEAPSRRSLRTVLGVYAKRGA